MSKEQNGRRIQLEYHYDRLSNRKMAQVYQLLVPNEFPLKIFSLHLPTNKASKENINSNANANADNNDNIEKGGNLSEDNSHLCTGFVAQTKRGKND
jgi:hypothetical protein